MHAVGQGSCYSSRQTEKNAITKTTNQTLWATYDQQSVGQGQQRNLN